MLIVNILRVMNAECHKLAFVLRVIMLNGVMLSVIMLNVVMLSVIMLIVVMRSVVAPIEDTK